MSLKNEISKVLLVENSYQDLVKSRFSLGNFLKESGFTVKYCCPNPDNNSVFDIPMSRNSIAPLKLVSGFFTLIRLEKKLASETVISFRFIPNVLNFLASFRSKSVKRVAVITGLGYAFIPYNISLVSTIQRILITKFYRIASKRLQVVAQNRDDLLELGIHNGRIISGSGVEKGSFKDPDSFNSSALIFLFAGRLLKSKGIIEAIEIFRRVKRIFPTSTLRIAGTLDQNNPDSLHNDELNELLKIDGIEYLGYVNDMDSVYVDSNVLLFPSFYREGIPRVIIESLKHGLTIITKDTPGCRETVCGNGYLIKQRGLEPELFAYINSLNAAKLMANREKSIELFANIFSSDIIYPQYLNLLHCE